jgi:hypothetical protein
MFDNKEYFNHNIDLIPHSNFNFKIRSVTVAFLSKETSIIKIIKRFETNYDDSLFRDSINHEYLKYITILVDQFFITRNFYKNREYHKDLDLKDYYMKETIGSFDCRYIVPGTSPIREFSPTKSNIRNLKSYIDKYKDKIKLLQKKILRHCRNIYYFII